MEAFKIFDRDGDGFISAHELRLVCKNLLGISLDTHYVNASGRPVSIVGSGRPITELY